VKKLILLLLLSPLAAAQIPARYDLPTVTTTSNPVPPGSLPNVLAVTNANVSVCGFPATITAGVCTNKIITYTDSSLSTPCPSTAPLTAPGSTACISTTGLQGTFGFWYNAATQTHITYTVKASWGTFGPYDILQSGTGGNSAPKVAYAATETGADAGQKIANAITAAGAGGLVVTRGLNGNIVSQIILPATTALDCSGSTFTMTGQDQGQTAGVIDIQGDNSSIFGGTQGDVCSFKRGDGTNIQTLIYVRQPSKYISLHDLYFDENRTHQTCPELTCFYAAVKSDPTGASTGDIRMWNVVFEHGMSRPFDFRSVNNLWVHNFKVEDCDTVNPNYGCEAGSIDEGGVFAPGIGGTSIANGGSSYPLSGSTLAYSAPHAGGTQATGTPIIANGVPNNLTLLTTAHDFTGPPWVKISDSTGKNTTASATISGQGTSVTVQNGGSFTGSPAGTLIWNNQPGIGGTLIGVYSGGGLASCTFTGGTAYRSGYVTGTPTSATGTGAFVVLSVDPITGAGAGCSVKNAGENYANTDTLTLTQVGGTGATCPAQFSAGALTGCQTGTLVGGDGYFASQTTYQLNLTSGTQVTAPQLTLVVTFYVQKIQFTNVTSGYTAPTCTMGGGGSITIPPATCSVGIGNGVWIGTTMTNKGTGYYVAGDPAPTVALSGTGGSGASGVPQQQVILNPTTNVFVSDGLISDYSDSFAMGRCVNCHMSRMTLLGRPYFGKTPRATAGGIDMADCDGCDADQIIIKGANGPQFGMIGFDIVGVTTVMPKHNQLSNFEFDPTATAPGVTPQDISGFDQLLEVGASSQPATCTDVGVSHGHMVGVRMLISNCDHVTVDNVQFTNINPIQGIHSAIDLHPFSFIPQVLQSIDIHDNRFSTTDASITSAVLYESALTGNFPFTQQGNIYENGIVDYLDPGGIMGASVDYQNMTIKQSTGYAAIPKYRIRCASGTQGTPGRLSNGSLCGPISFEVYDAAGQGFTNADGFITGVDIIAQQISTPSGGQVSVAGNLRAQNAAGGGGMVSELTWEPNAVISNVPHYFLAGITLGTAGPSWTFGASAPTGACVSGSLYSNTGGSPNTFYVCQSSAWVGK